MSLNILILFSLKQSYFVKSIGITVNEITNEPDKVMIIAAANCVKYNFNSPVKNISGRNTIIVVRVEAKPERRYFL